MKKRIFGMIVTLCLMMVLPLAIYAAEPTLSVSGGLSQSADGKNVSVQVAVDGTATLTVKNASSVTYDKGGDSTVSYSGSGTSIAIKGESVNQSGVTITVTADGETLTCTVTVVPKAVTDLTLTGTRTTMENGASKDYTGETMQQNKRFFVGDAFSVTGGTVRYNSGESRAIDPSEIVTDKPTFTAMDRVVTYTFTGRDPNPERAETQTFAKTYAISVEARKKIVTDVELTSDDVKLVYYEGENFDFNTIKLKVQEEGTNEFKYAFWSKTPSETGFTADPVVMSLSTREFTIRYDNEPYTYSFASLGIRTVTAKSVELKLIEGAKDEYVIGEAFSFDSVYLDVEETGSDGNRRTYKVFSDGFTFTPNTSSNTYVFRNISSSPNLVTITYDNKPYEFDLSDLVTVRDSHKLTAIRAEGTPTKQNYIEGQTVTDWGGIRFYAIYSYVDPADNSTKTHEELIPQENYRFLTVLPFEYSTTYPAINGVARVAYTEGNYTTPYTDVPGFHVSPKKVVKIEVTTPPTTTFYNRGDQLNLDGMRITLTYNNGNTEIHSYADPIFTCTPAHGETVSVDTNKITVVYKEGDTTLSTEWTGISVDNKPHILRAYISTRPNKMTYEVGERFDPAGMTVTLLFDDNKTPDYVLKNLNVSATFTSETNTKITFKVTNPYIPGENDIPGETADVTLNDIKVTPKVVPTALTVTGGKSTYLAGEYASISDITALSVTLSDTTRPNLDKKAVDALVKDREATLTLTPNTRLTNRNTQLTVTFTYKETTVSGTWPIKVTDPACTLSTSTTSTGLTSSSTPYESLELALEAANALTTTEARRVTITLQDDVALSSRYQFNAERSITIDLNGYNLTMKENQIFVPHKTAYRNVEVVILNTSSRTSRIIYDEEDEAQQMLLDRSDEIVINYETDIPGLYEITLTAGEHGTITGPQEVAFGNDAKYTITPDEGYEVLEVFVDKQSKGKATTLTLENVSDNHEIVVGFTEKVEVWENPFTDISSSASYYSAIEFVYENELFTGVTNTRFEPNSTMTRAMFVTVLGRLAGVSETDPRYTGASRFPDVVSSAATSWYVPYVSWATSAGIIKGYEEDGTFRPDRAITHTEMYIMMERYARSFLGVTSSANGTVIRATDTDDIPKWEGAYEAVQFASLYDFLVTGTATRITPNANAMRYELAVLLEKFCTAFNLLAD